jgi:broad specificity phosphatase PhoE
MKVYFARHGEYQNPEGIVPYRMPGFPLTDLGISQAGLQANKLLSLNIRDIFSSPVERCVQTASIIGSSLHLAVNQKSELTETGTPLQGLTKGDLAKLSPNYPYDVPSHIEAGGETPEQIYSRIHEFTEKLKLMSSKSSHLVVSHGDPITIFLIKTLTGKMPHLIEEFEKSKVRYIPMGGLVCLDFNQSGIPKYTEII